MFRELYVDILKDRVMTRIILTALVVFYVLICLVLPVWSELLMGIVSLLILITTELLIFYLHLDLAHQQAGVDTDEHTTMIANIEDVGKKLSDLAVFLRRERESIEASEATLKRLRSEHSELEPVVKTNRKILETVLAAHNTATASRAWKERALAFMTGVITSLLASALYELFRGKL